MNDDPVEPDGRGAAVEADDVLDGSDGRADYHRDELCALCRIDSVRLVEYVRHGVLVAEDERGVRFAAPALRRARRAVRVQREFEIDLESLALVVDLFERLEAQRREIRVLRARLRPG